MTLPQNCATCGKSLEDRQPPTCPRCKTLYCGSDCQRADWKAGHKKICKAIAEEGGAAQRHANEKAAEAVAALLKERAAPAKTACRLCKKTTSEEFVAVWCERCSTKDRLAHASCLAKYAARVAEGVDDFRGWERCKGCTQEFTGAAKVAAARLCWKEYAGRDESDQLRCWAAEALGCALYADGQYEDARDTFLAHLKVIKSAGVNWQDTETPLAMTRENLAKCAHALGRLDELLAMRREMYAETQAKHFVTDQRTIDAALNLASALLSSDETEEAQKFCREILRKLKRGCPPNDARVVTLTCALAQTLYDPAAQDREYMMSDVQEAETLLMEALQASRQAFGAGHDQTARVRQELDAVRAARRGDEVDGSKLERGPIVLDKPDEGDEKTIDSID